MKEFLSQRDVPFTERDVSVDRAAANEMVHKTGQMGVPVITVGNEVVIGFDRARLESLLANASRGSGRPHFGLQVADATRVAGRFGLSPVPGALVGKVAAGSPGEKARLMPGDIITEVNSQPVRSASDLEEALENLTGGSQVSIVFTRAQSTHKTEIII